MERKYLHTIEVEISEIEGNFEYIWFDFVLWINCKKHSEGRYETDHSWGKNYKGLIRIYEQGEALNAVVQQELGNA